MQAMLHFVKKWGPLFQQWGSGQDFEPENPFAWIWCQVNLRAMWESRGRQAEKHHWPVTSRIDSERLGPHEKIENLPLNVQLVLKAHRKNVERERAKERETWQGLIPRDATGLSEMEAPHLTLRSDTQRNPVCAAGADTIEQFAKLMVFAADASRLRMCWRPDCPTPYFIADDLKAHYCSEDCSRWSRAEHKRNWWKERGSEWRESKNERKSK
ncbi:MAG: hypothetical protein JO340_16210 [Acidobacteriaceae bacterium]|nr:hypothetical protein [Acidobacteriaceae bacterium]